MVMDKITSFRMEWRGMAVNPAICWLHCHSKVGSLTDRLLIGRSGCACVCVSLLSASSRTAPPRPRLSLSLPACCPSRLSLSLPTCRLFSLSPRFPSNIIVVELPFHAAPRQFSPVIWPVLAIPPSKSLGPVDISELDLSVDRKQDIDRNAGSTSLSVVRCDIDRNHIDRRNDRKSRPLFSGRRV